MQIRIDHAGEGVTPWMAVMREDAELPQLVQAIMDRGVLGESVVMVTLQVANGDQVRYKV